MATYVEAAGLGILVDPGASLAPSRFGLPPAEEEWEALRRANDRISAYACRSRYVFVSHYHEDHFRSDPASYEGRTVLAKDPRRMVAGQQARRASELWRALDGKARVQPADGAVLRDGAVELRVSAPLPHGPEGTTLGHVVALTIAEPDQRERFVFASDVQGPLSAVATAYLVRERPTLLYLSGPPAYIEREVGAAAVERGVDHLRRILDATGCRVIMDHHALRDGTFSTRFERLWATGRVVTAAGHLGVQPRTLEAQRHRLWAAARKPPVRAGAPAAMLPRAPARRAAKGGHAV